MSFTGCINSDRLSTVNAKVMKCLRYNISFASVQNIFNSYFLTYSCSFLNINLWRHFRLRKGIHIYIYTHTHTHTHSQICICIYIKLNITSIKISIASCFIFLEHFLQRNSIFFKVAIFKFRFENFNGYV